MVDYKVQLSTIVQKRMTACQKLLGKKDYGECAFQIFQLMRIVRDTTDDKRTFEIFCLLRQTIATFLNIIDSDLKEASEEEEPLKTTYNIDELMSKVNAFFAAFPEILTSDDYDQIILKISALNVELFYLYFK